MMREFTRQFWAMGSDVELRIWHENEQRARRALTYTERLFVQTESRLSRFRPNSELSRLNRAAGQPFKASQMLYAIVKLALDWRARTGGIFDPTILNDLVAWGYDRPFLDIQAEQQALADSGATAARVPTPAMQTSADGNRRNPSSIDIKLDLKGQITLPPGIGLDLGGIAKGWTAQRAAQRLGVLGPALVDAGGDIACVGAPPNGPWMVGVADPQVEDQDLAFLSLSSEAVATSSRVHRRWLHRGQAAHHLIDPRTRAPAITNIVSATVIAPRLPDAEIHAKTALILGEKDGVAYLDGIPGITSILITDDGRQVWTGHFEEKAYVTANNFADRFRIAD
jgi:thiamine biosynthesis lipoprotein